MPVMDGVTFLSHLRRREDTELIPFILLTARSSDEDKVDGLLLGADGENKFGHRAFRLRVNTRLAAVVADYLTKPFSGKELVARARTHYYRRYLSFLNASLLISPGPSPPFRSPNTARQKAIAARAEVPRAAQDQVRAPMLVLIQLYQPNIVSAASLSQLLIDLSPCVFALTSTLVNACSHS